MADTDPMLGKTVQSAVIVEADPLLGLNLGGYVVTKLLAQGGMGLVYEAKHETIGRRAAVKVLKPEVANDAEWSKRFLTEARAIAALNHRNIVEILNFGNTPDGRQYMMMAFLEGESLEQYIQRVAPMPPAVALGIVDQVLNGLAEAHKKGVVHRDLKPSNVALLREHSGELLVKILDFGLARQDPVALVDATHVVRGQEGSSLLAGTPEYIAPEQAQGLKVDAAADLYSLGVMLYEMLTAELPFSAENVVALLQKHVSEAPPLLSHKVSNLPEGLDELVASLLEKDPARRPGSADVARQTVQRLMKRLTLDATMVRAMPSKYAPTQKLERVVKEVSPSQVTAPAASPTTDRAIAEALAGPRRRWVVPAVVAVAAVGLLVVSLSLRERGEGQGEGRLPDVPVAKLDPVKVDVAPAVDPPKVDPVKVNPPKVDPPKVDPPKAAAAKQPEKAPEKAPDKAPTTARVLVAAKQPTTVQVEPVNCTPDDRWKKDRLLDLRELGNLASAKSPAASATFDEADATLSRAIKAATTPSECVTLTRQLKKLTEDVTGGK